MKKDRLEDFIKDNREEFDFRTPSAEVWDKIAVNSKTRKVIPLKTYFLRASVILAIVALGALGFWQVNSIANRQLAINADPELLELIEAEAFYAQQVDVKLKEIQKCYYTFPELKDEIENDLTELEEMYRDLKTDLKENISNKSVIEAMIENNRFRMKLCENVLEQIKC
jgi:hypothetical protein